MESHAISTSPLLSASPVDGQHDVERLDRADSADALGMAHPGLADHEPQRPATLEDKARSADAEAKKCGVDIAKRGFFSKLLTLVAASAVLVAAALVTGLSGGAGIPLLALAGAGFAIAVGDVACAACDWYSKAHGGDGLAMGGDSLGNLLHKISSKCGASNEVATKIATYGSILTRRSLSVGTAAVGGFMAVATPSVLHSAVAGMAVGRTVLDMADGTLTGNSTLLGREKQAHETKAAEARAQKDAAEPLLHQLGTQSSQLQGKEAQLGQAQHNIYALEKELSRTIHALAKYEQQLATQAEENSGMRKEMENMHKQLGGMHEQLDTLSHQLGATTQKSRDQQETIADQENCIKQLRSQVAQLKSILAPRTSETTSLLPSSETRPRSQSVPLFA